MRTGDKSGVLTAKVGKDHIFKFKKITEHYNELNDFHYVPKYKIMQDIIDREYERINRPH